MWYAIYTLNGGALVNVMQNPPSSGYLASQGQGAVAIGTTLPPITAVWNPTSLSFVTPVNKGILTRLEFLSLLTQPIRTAIRSSSDPVVQDILFLLEMSSQVQLNNPLLIEGLSYLVSVGLLTSAQQTSILAGQPL